MNPAAGLGLALNKARRVLGRRLEAWLGRFLPLDPTLETLAARPYELHLELTNLCNANCVFCPYQFQEREVQYMSAAVLEKALGDFARCGGGSVGLTPIVGDALIHPDFLRVVRRLRAEERIDRIWVTTNAILIDKHGVEEVLSSGLTSITVSTSGFDEPSYKRIYRSSAYARMLRNVHDLVRVNHRLGSPAEITIGLRTDRALERVMADPDFQPILEFEPAIDFTWSYTSAGGRIRRDLLPSGMRLRVVQNRKEPCVQLFNGPIVLPDGSVMACSCVAAMDAVKDLGIGNVLAADLLEIYASAAMRSLRAGFGTPALNPTCARCDMYRDLELYRTREGRERARISRARGRGEVVRRARPEGAFAGG